MYKKKLKQQVVKDVRKFLTIYIDLILHIHLDIKKKIYSYLKLYAMSTRHYLELKPTDLELI